MASVGSVLPIALKLFDANTTKFVRATIIDDDGVVITGSPFSLVHKTLGLYSLDTVLMPDKDFVTAIYEVFDDAGFTTKSNVYADAVECFSKDALDDAIDTLLAVSRRADIVGEISGPLDFNGEVLDSTALVAEIGNNNLTGEITDNETIKGVIDNSDTITASLD